METIDLILALKKTTHRAHFVALKQALIYILHNSGVPVMTISKIMECSRQIVYKHYYKVRDLKDIHDKMIQDALDELGRHEISVRPCTVENGIYNQTVGYKLIIDNIIY
jgi:hypothetical protein